MQITEWSEGEVTNPAQLSQLSELLDIIDVWRLKNGAESADKIYGDLPAEIFELACTFRGVASFLRVGHRRDDGVLWGELYYAEDRTPVIGVDEEDNASPHNRAALRVEEGDHAKLEVRFTDEVGDSAEAFLDAVESYLTVVSPRE